MVHEVSHQNGSDETKAHFLTDVAADSWNTENQFNGNATNTSKVNQGEWLNNQTTDSDGNRTADSLINQNTIKASQVDEFDPYITVQLHEVAFDKYHASIKFKPVNQELYERNDDFRIDPIDGKRYITLGAGPSLGDNKLTGNLARKNDMQIDNKVLESLPIVSIEKEDEVFNQLIELNENYNQNPLEYDMFPNPNKTKISKVSNVGGKLNRPGDSYNSNSYVSGILSAADVYVPPIDQDLDVSGYNKPVPKENFIGEN